MENTQHDTADRRLAATTGSGFYRAYVEVLQGNRTMSDFMASAGLGLTGVGVRKTMTIDYKPGEEVDAARVSKAMDSMIEASNRERTDFKILSYKVLGVTLIPNEAALHRPHEVGSVARAGSSAKRMGQTAATEEPPHSSAKRMNNQGQPPEGTR